ncbi:MlaA family lipoprotein [Xanthomonas sp. GPE 39]|uniref:MlaA family lipoprotein n=1 Tax=Xanthomonas sp. GPE 39 TaxID=1583099 RepID=UPI0005F2DC5E|nr:MlaA family lipoprotein [Xanthomonas sp. GPE 39]
MNVLRILTSLVLTLVVALNACASTSTPPSPVAASADPSTPPPATDSSTTASTMPAATDSAPASSPQAVASGAASTGTQRGAPTSAEDDYAALYASDPNNQVADATLPDGTSVQSYDPWEKFNRKVHAFNNVVDHAVARPLARTYVNVVPQPARLGVTNFFNNLGSPLTMVNQVLQGHPLQAGQTLSRFVINSTLGIGGILDPATDAKLPRRTEDFGQTFGVWGWRRSRYVELPFFGPRTVRDVFGLAADTSLSPLQQIEDDRVRIGLQGLQLVDIRAQLLPLDSMRDQAPDEYQLTRDAWLQRRNYQIENDLRRPHHGEDKDLPDYLREEDKNPTVPADAMPMLQWHGGTR